MKGLICRQTRWCLLGCFVLNCVHAPPARAVTAISLWKIRFMTAISQLKVPKSHERYHNVVTWHWIVYKWHRSKQRLSFHRTFFNLLVFTVSLSCRDWHSETPWSHSSNRPGGTYCQALDFLLRTNYVMRECKIGKSSPHQPCENTCHSNVLELSPLLWMARALACFFRADQK